MKTEIKLIDTVAVASLLQVSVRTVTNYVEKGILPPPVKLGGKARWDEQIILKAIAKMRKQ